MIIESLVLAGAVTLAHEVHQAFQRRAQEKAATDAWLKAILASQHIQATTTVARRAMLDEIRRVQGNDFLSRGGGPR